MLKASAIEEINLLADPDETNDDVSADPGVEIRSLPYRAISDQYLPFNNPDLKRLIPNCPVQLTFREISSTKYRSSWYTIDLEHGCFHWSLRRSYGNILVLHNQLKMHRAFMSFHLPRIKREKDGESHHFVLLHKSLPNLPTFPHKSSSYASKKVALETYLRDIMTIPLFRDYHKTLEFLEIGPFSFIEDLGTKSKEGFVKISKCGVTCIGLICSKACRCWKKRWLFLKDNFLGVINPSGGELEYVMLMDKASRAKTRRMTAGYTYILTIKNLTRKLILHCESKRQAHEWAQELNFFLDRESAKFLSPNTYESFAPPRSMSKCKWIVDGATYFEAVANAIEAAQEEIFIADWWLSPEIYLKRPTTHGHYWQLDYLLHRKAREGVKIYVLLYKELELALGIDSKHAEEKLSRLHPNIQVLRHPCVTKVVWLWFHHEKIVCIDQTFAFTGGIDLCYGRWDDFQHRLTDIGENEEEIEVKRHASNDNMPTSTSTRVKVSSEIFSVKQTSLSPESKKLFKDVGEALSAEELNEDSTSENSILVDSSEDHHSAVDEMALHLGLERKFRLWHCKDYCNFISKDFEDLEKPYTDIIDRNTVQRMPWHDVGIYVQGMVARDIARHFILRWNQAKEENYSEEGEKPYLMPKGYSNFLETPFGLQNVVGSLYKAECQVLRSLSSWSGDISETEISIHKAYIDVISEAKKFIYIENQFFITLPACSEGVENAIHDALFHRILKAYREKEDFRVYVVLPLLPAFEGEINTGTGTLIQTVTYWTYRSINRGHDSLMRRLSIYIKDPWKYIGFYGLRNYGTLAGKLVTELIYVHSKLLIADDQVAIIGSANINDRSLLGRRDSEVAVLVRDTNFLEEPNGAGQFCYSLRKALFKEYLGLMDQPNSDVDLRDASSSDFYENVWKKIAVSNTDIYEEVFRSIPSDSIKTFQDLKRRNSDSVLASTDPEAAKEKLKQIKGYLVTFPLLFLRDEILQPHPGTKKHYLPDKVFT